MARMRRDRRLPGQSARYRDHPSNVGSSSYYADTGRGWVPNPGVNLNRQALNNAAANRAKNIRQPTFGGDQGRGGQGNVYRAPTRHHPSYITQGPVRGRGSGAPGGIGGGIGATAPGQEFIEEELIEKGSTGAFDHPAYAHAGPFLKSLPMPKVMGMVGDTISDAARGSRLHKDYKDEYGKIEGTKRWQEAKRSMMTDDEKAFEKKYKDLAAATDDPKRRAELLATAEGAWRNKQTSDRLAAFERFEGYDPGKYSGLGEGSRYTGDVYEGQGRTGEFVPGVGIMDDILDRYYQDQGPGTDTRANQNFVDVKNAMEAMGGLGAGDYSDPDEIFEDITADIGGGGTEDDYYTEGELWEDTSNDLYGDALYETGEMMPDEQYSLWEDPGFYNVPLARGPVQRRKQIQNPNLLRKFGDLAARNSGILAGPRGMGPIGPRGVNMIPELIDEEEILFGPGSSNPRLAGG